MEILLAGGGNVKGKPLQFRIPESFLNLRGISLLHLAR